jgi:succinylarginine dihydrolase
LLSTEVLADEGAANHNRFCNVYTDPGIELFVYGKEVFSEHENKLKIFPARQTLEASQAIARLHRLNSDQIIFAKQNPAVIDAGVFHNDVVAVSNQNVFLYHELAYQNTMQVINALKRFFPENFYFLDISNAALSMAEAVSAYLFNSQILTLPDGTMAIIAPQECQEFKKAHNVLLNILDNPNPIQHIHFINCRESMKNGGGPACLRLRVVLTEEEKKMSHAPVYLTESLYQTLVQWVNKYYRDKLEIKDLLDPLLIQESREALEELTQILQLGSIYDFQYDLTKDE